MALSLAGPLAYARAGAGEPVVFLHGLALDRQAWETVAALLAPAYDTIRLELRGHGATPRATAPHFHHEDVAAALDALGVDSAHVVGLSLGGAVAVDLALAHPGKVRSLALVDSALEGHEWSAEWRRGFRAVRAVGHEHGAAAARDAWARHPLFSALVRPHLERDDGVRWTTPQLARPLDPPAAGRLAEIRVPALVVVGERDQPDFRAIADFLASRIPGARQVVLPGTGHVAPLEAPELLADTLREFLARASGRRG